MASEDDDTLPDRNLFVLGRNIAKIPCFRSTFLTAIPTGFVCGIGYFLFTSHLRHATHVAMGTFTCTATGNWVYCRYQWSKKRFEMARIKAAVQRRTLYEGTAQDPDVKPDLKDA